MGGWLPSPAYPPRMAHLLCCRPPALPPGDQGGSGRHGRLGLVVASQRCPPSLPACQEGRRERRPGVRSLRQCLSAQGRPGTCGQGRDLDRGLAPPRPHQLPAGACGVSARVLELWGLERCLRAGASAVSGSWVAGQRGPGLWLSRFLAPAQFLSPPILSRDPPRNFQCAEPPACRITKQGAGSGEPSCDLRPGQRPCHFQAVLNGRSAESPPAPSPGQDP